MIRIKLVHLFVQLFVARVASKLLPIDLIPCKFTHYFAFVLDSFNIHLSL